MPARPHDRIHRGALSHEASEFRRHGHRTLGRRARFGGDRQARRSSGAPPGRDRPGLPLDRQRSTDSSCGACSPASETSRPAELSPTTAVSTGRSTRDTARTTCRSSTSPPERSCRSCRSPAPTAGSPSPATARPPTLGEPRGGSTPIGTDGGRRRRRGPCVRGRRSDRPGHRTRPIHAPADVRRHRAATGGRSARLARGSERHARRPPAPRRAEPGRRRSRSSIWSIPRTRPGSCGSASSRTTSVADPDGQRAYVFNELDGTVSVVDLARRRSSRASASAAPGATSRRTRRDARRPAPPSPLCRRDQPRPRRGRSTRQPAQSSAPCRVARPRHTRNRAGGPRRESRRQRPSTRRTAVRTQSLRSRPLRPARPRRPSPAFRLIGRLPTAAYPSAVAVTPDGRTARCGSRRKGSGAGPNPEYGEHFANSGAAPYGSYVPDKLLGYVGVLKRPTDRADAQSHRSWPTVRCGRRTPAPPRRTRPCKARTAARASRSSTSSTSCARTAPTTRSSAPSRAATATRASRWSTTTACPGPAGGVTPNAHALARRFPLLDHVYADSEVSTDGHVITSSAYAIDFVQKALHADYSGRGRVNTPDQFPETYPPNAFVFDQAVRQNVSFRNFGEFVGRACPNDGRPTYPAVDRQLRLRAIRSTSAATGPTRTFVVQHRLRPLRVRSAIPPDEPLRPLPAAFNQWVAGGADKFRRSSTSRCRTTTRTARRPASRHRRR